MSKCDHGGDYCHCAVEDIVKRVSDRFAAIKDENQKLRDTLLKFRDLIEFGPFFDATATMLVNEADELLNPAASYDPRFRLKAGRWVPKVECDNQSVMIRSLNWEGY